VMEPRPVGQVLTIGVPVDTHPCRVSWGHSDTMLQNLVRPSNQQARGV
jgi:hypothetical protein